jgi:uncharacterized protein (DUF58 family)
MRRYHLRGPFWIYCGLTLMVAVAALGTSSNLLIWVFGVMTSALLVSGAVSGLMLVRLDVRRLSVDRAAVGEPLVVRYAVSNRGGLMPAFGIRLEERAAGTAATRRGWERLMAPAPAWLLHLGPRESVHAEAVFLPRRRGEAWFDALRIRTTFPFGIVEKSITRSQPQRVLVEPRVEPLRRRVLDAVAPPATVGTTITARAGAGDDYYGLREFRPGDSMRHVAWKRTANRDQLVAIERSRPSPRRLRIVLNLTAPPPAQSGENAPRRAREEDAISLAASLAHAAGIDGYEVGLTILGLPLAPVPVRRGHWHRNRLLAALAEIDLDAKREPARSLPLRDLAAAGLVAVHPEEIDPDLLPLDAWHFSARQIDRLVRRSAVAPEARTAAAPDSPRAEGTAA